MLPFGSKKGLKEKIRPDTDFDEEFVKVEKEDIESIPFTQKEEEPEPTIEVKEEKPQEEEYEFYSTDKLDYRERISYEIGQLMLNLYINGDVIRETENGSVITQSKYFLMLYRGLLNQNITEVYDIEQGFVSKAKEFNISNKKLLKKYFIDCIVDSNKLNAYTSGVKLSDIFGKVIYKLIESIGSDYYDMLGIKHVISIYKLCLQNRLISENAVKNTFFEIARQSKVEKTIANVLYKHFYVLVYGKLPMFHTDRELEFYHETDIDVEEKLN